MKVAILICALTATASAVPRPAKLDAKLSEHVNAAEQAWTVAESEHDVQKQAALWEQAAAAFAEVDGDPVDPKVKHAAAFAAVLAWKNALAVATPRSFDDQPAHELPARERKLITAIDRYASYSDPSDPELPDLLLLEARTYAGFDRTEAAVPIVRIIVERYRKDTIVVDAAHLILDSYNRLHQDEHLIAFAAELANDDTLMRAHPDLAEPRLARSSCQAKRKHVEQLEAAARAAHALDNYAAVGAAYLELYNADPKQPNSDELLYNAGVAFETGRSLDAAIRAFELLQHQHRHESIAVRALARLGHIYAQLAMYTQAADKLEQYAKKYPGEKDAFDAISDAVFLRKGIGDRNAAIDDTEYLIKTYGPKRPREAENAMWSLTALYAAEPIARSRISARTCTTTRRKAMPRTC